MAFGSASLIFSSAIHDALQRVGSMDADSANAKCALYNDSVVGGTPKTDTSLHNAYNGTGGQWVTANAVTDTGSSAPNGWPTVGRPLAWSTATKISTSAAATLKYDSDDTVSANAVTTLVNVFGALIYDDDASATVVDQGWCMLSFGGTTQGVTLGTFTVVYHTNGIMSIAM